jgi:hypothetical protein
MIDINKYLHLANMGYNKSIICKGIAYQMAMGRPSKISPKIKAKILDAIEGNLPYDMAAWSARICEKTLYTWINKGKADREAGIESEYLDLLQGIKEVEANKVRKLEANIEMGIERWQSQAWLLERRWRQYFGADAGIIAELQQTFNDLKDKFEAQQKKS